MPLPWFVQQPSSPHEETQVPFAEGDDATETLLLNRADEPLGIRVEIGTLRRETDRLDTPAL